VELEEPLLLLGEPPDLSGGLSGSTPSFTRLFSSATGEIITRPSPKEMKPRSKRKSAWGASISPL